MRVNISRNFGFEAAHFIPDHKGACKNLHGHSYTGAVTISSESLDAMGMVMDYGDLKVIIKELIEDPCDHAMLNGLYVIPTAEIMVRDMFGDLQQRLERDYPLVRLEKVSLKETANSEAWVAAE